MAWQMAAMMGSQLLSGALQSRSADKASKRQAEASQAAIGEQREARESFEARTQPFVDIGMAASPSLFSLLGISPPPQQDTRIPDLESRISSIDQQLSAPQQEFSANPRMAAAQRIQALTQGAPDIDKAALTQEREGLLSQLDALRSQQSQMPTPSMQPSDQLAPYVNPLVEHLRQEGFEDIQESAAARGRLRSGGTLQDLTRFNTQLSATIAPQLQEQRFNQLFNLLGLGQSSAVGQGQAALQTAGNIGNLQQSIGAARAQGALGQGQAMQNTISGLAGTFGAAQGGLFSPPPPTNPFANTYNTGTVFDPSTGAMGSAVTQPSQMFGGI